MTTSTTHILHCLQRIDRPLTFCARTVAPPILPGLSVDGAGPIALPLDESQAAILERLGDPAAYGKGTETVIDPRVRLVLRFAPDRFRLDNPAWSDWLDRVVDVLRGELGLDRKLVPHLHELLLYRPGDFFLPHRDGEKRDGMVATMVIVLPAAFTGGDVIVRHAGEEVRFAFDDAERAFDFQVAAWYADCEHEITPLTAGHRLVLVYNLVVARSKRGIKAPAFAAEIDALALALQRWSQEPSMDGPPCLAIPLAHAYSEAGLAPDLLKGPDRAQALALFKAAGRSGLDAYLALLTRRVVGDAVVDYDDDHSDPDAVEMGDIIDQELSADHWIDAAGTPVAFGSMPVHENAVLGGVKSLTEDIERQEFEGYTGNAGMVLTRWYHRAAIILWPEDRQAEMLCRSDIGPGIAWLQHFMGGSSPSHGREAPPAKARRLCTAIFDRWVALNHHPEIGLGVMADLLARIGDKALALRYLGDVLLHDASESPGAGLVRLAERFGWNALSRTLLDLFAASTGERLERDARIIAEGARDAAAAALWLAGCDHLVRVLLAAPVSPSLPMERFAPIAPSTDHRAILGLIVPVLHRFGASDLMLTLAAGLDASRFDVGEVQVPAVRLLIADAPALPAWPPFRHWLNLCQDALVRRVADEPKAPTDQRRSGLTSCDCDDCRQLDTFLRDPVRKSERFAMREARRQHLKEVITRQRCDLDCVTERRGSPHALVCTKNQKTHDRRKKQHRRDRADLEMISAALDAGGRGR